MEKSVVMSKNRPKTLGQKEQHLRLQVPALLFEREDSKVSGRPTKVGSKES